MAECIFCKIVKGEIPSYQIYEDKDVLVFLDAFPMMKGQTLIVPKKHLTPYLFELDNKQYTALMLIAKKIAKAIDKALSPIKTGMIVEGLEVEHIHIKLYPLMTKKGFRYTLNKKLSDKEMKDIAEKIKREL